MYYIVTYYIVFSIYMSKCVLKTMNLYSAMDYNTALSIIGMLVHPESCAQKNPKVVLNLWQKLHKKLGKVVLKLCTIWLIF